MLSQLEIEIVKALQEGLPLVSRPFSAIAEKLCITEDMLLGKITDMMKRGLIRRFGAAVRHQDLGYTSNAMIVWNVPVNDVERIGTIFSDFFKVSHCYQRQICGEWMYNLFTMVHGRTVDDCWDLARSMSEATGITDYMVLFSDRELKKSSMKYFIESGIGD